MSQFMSNKFLRARRALAGETMTEDRYCEGCGYNLRGLQFGQACPECGLGSLSSGGGVRASTRDPLLTVDEGVRRSMKLGFRLGSLTLLGATILLIALVRYIDLIGDYIGGAILFIVIAAVLLGAAKFWKVNQTAQAREVRS